VKIRRPNIKAFTLTELLITVVISIMGISMILASYMFIQKSWTVEYKRTFLRHDLIKALENIKVDLGFSSSTYISFYPVGSNIYTAISMPVVDPEEPTPFSAIDLSCVYLSVSVKPLSRGSMTVRLKVLLLSDSVYR